MFCLRTDRSITPGISILKPTKTRKLLNEFLAIVGNQQNLFRAFETRGAFMKLCFDDKRFKLSALKFYFVDKRLNYLST